MPYRAAGSRGVLRAVDAIASRLFALYLCSLRKPAAAVVAQEAAIERLEAQLIAHQEGELTPSGASTHCVNNRLTRISITTVTLPRSSLARTGAAVIVFNYERHALNLLRNQRRTKHFLFTSCSAHLSRNSVVARRAPLPRNVFWENGVVAGVSVVWRRVASWTLFFLVLATSGFLQTTIFRRSQDELLTRLNSDAAGSSTSASASYEVRPGHRQAGRVSAAP